MDAAIDAQRALDLGVSANQRADVLCTYGQLLADLDQPEAAATALLEAIEVDDESTEVSAYARSGLGVAASYRNEREAALRYFEESLKSAPDNSWVYFNRAQAYERWRENALARADYEQALKVSAPALPPFRRQQWTVWRSSANHHSEDGMGSVKGASANQSSAASF